MLQTLYEFLCSNFLTLGGECIDEDIRLLEHFGLQLLPVVSVFHTPAELVVLGSVWIEAKPNWSDMQNLT